MKNNKIQDYFNELPKIYKLFTKKKFINGCYIFFGILCLISFLLIFLVLGMQGKNINWALWLGLALLILLLILFYIFEFFRRRCKNFLTNIFNFKNLYEEFLLENKLIEDQMNKMDNTLELMHQHINTLEINYNNATLGASQKIYSLFKDKQVFLLSTNFVNNYEKKYSKQDDMILILSCEKREYKNDFYITKKNDSNTLLNLRKISNDDDKVSIFSNNESLKNFKNQKDINKLILLVENDSDYNLSISAKNGKLYYIFIMDNRLFIEFNDIKLYKQNYDELETKYESNKQVVKHIFSLI